MLRSSLNWMRQFPEDPTLNLKKLNNCEKISIPEVSTASPTRPMVTRLSLLAIAIVRTTKTAWLAQDAIHCVMIIKRK